MRNERTTDIVLIAMFTSLVMVATYIGVPTPASMGGYMHFGTLVMLAVALKYGKKYGALAGGIGMTLFDLFSPWAAWAPGTLVVRLTMGFVVGLIAYDRISGQGNNLVKNILAILAGAVIMIGGYFIYQAWMLSSANGGGFELALTSIPGNAVQIIVGMISLVLVYFLPNKESISKI